MPVYEYECTACRHRFQELVGMVAGAASEASHEPLVCPRCGMRTAVRRVSRFVRGRSEEARLDEALDRAQYLDSESASSVEAQMMEMGRAMDDDLSGEMQELFETQVLSEIEPESSRLENGG